MSHESDRWTTDFGPIRLLVVDADRGFCTAAKDFFAARGCHVTYALTGAEAHQRVQSHCFDAVLLDWGLPEGDGPDLLEDLKTKHPHLPVVLSPTTGGDMAHAEALRRGADCYWPKPGSSKGLADLLPALNGLVQRSRGRSPYHGLEAVVTHLGVDVSALSDTVRRAIILVCEDLAMGATQESHAPEVVSLLKLTEDVGLSSPDYFGRKFTEDVGMPPGRFISMLRLQVAKAALVGTQHRLTDISRRLGFGELKNMRRTFKKHEGCTPGEYRRRERGNK